MAFAARLWLTALSPTQTDFKSHDDVLPSQPIIITEENLDDLEYYRWMMRHEAPDFLAIPPSVAKQARGGWTWQDQDDGDLYVATQQPFRPELWMKRRAQDDEYGAATKRQKKKPVQSQGRIDSAPERAQRPRQNPAAQRAIREAERNIYMSHERGSASGVSYTDSPALDAHRARTRRRLATQQREALRAHGDMAERTQLSYVRNAACLPDLESNSAEADKRSTLESHRAWWAQGLAPALHPDRAPPAEGKSGNRRADKPKRQIKQRRKQRAPKCQQVQAPKSSSTMPPATRESPAQPLRRSARVNKGKRQSRTTPSAMTSSGAICAKDLSDTIALQTLPRAPATAIAPMAGQKGKRCQQLSPDTRIRKPAEGDGHGAAERKADEEPACAKEKIWGDSPS